MAAISAVVRRSRCRLHLESDTGAPTGVDVQRFKQSQYDPCYFWKHLDDGTRMDLVMYVDDGYVVDESSPLADAELKLLHEAFTIEIKPARFFLGNNIIIHDVDAVAGGAAVPTTVQLWATD